MSTTPGSIASGQVNVTAGAAVEIVAARTGRTQLRLFGLGSITGNFVAIGPDNTVTAATGYFEAGTLVLATDADVWGIASGNALNVRFLEVF